MFRWNIFQEPVAIRDAGSIGGRQRVQGGYAVTGTPRE